MANKRLSSAILNGNDANVSISSVMNILMVASAFSRPASLSLLTIIVTLLSGVLLIGITHLGHVSMTQLAISIAALLAISAGCASVLAYEVARKAEGQERDLKHIKETLERVSSDIKETYPVQDEYELWFERITGAAHPAISYSEITASVWSRALDIIFRRYALFEMCDDDLRLKRYHNIFHFCSLTYRHRSELVPSCDSLVARVAGIQSKSLLERLALSEAGDLDDLAHQLLVLSEKRASYRKAELDAYFELSRIIGGVENEVLSGVSENCDTEEEPYNFADAAFSLRLSDDVAGLPQTNVGRRS